MPAVRYNPLELRLVKRGVKENTYVCIACGKFGKLSINNTTGLGYCFVCNTSYVPRLANKLSRFSLLKNNRPFVPVIAEGARSVCSSDELLLSYLSGRAGYGWYQFKTFTGDEVVVPFFDRQGKEYYYLVRNLSGALRYEYPAKSVKPLFMLYGQSDIIYIVEGVFDALAIKQLYPNANCVAVLGSSISNQQSKMFRQNFSSEYHIVVALDTPELTDKLIQRLHKELRYKSITPLYLPQDCKDPEVYVISHSQFE